MSRELASAQINAVPSSVPRATMERTIHAFFASYPATNDADVRGRVNLFADDAVFEDPVGAPVKQGQYVLAEFFSKTIESGLHITMRADQIIVCGNEAISRTYATWGRIGEEPAKVQAIHNFVFDENGKIKRLRFFFDDGCIA